MKTIFRSAIATAIVTAFLGEITAASSTPAGTKKEIVLHAFEGYPSDGGEPMSPVIKDKYGNIYGTTFGSAFGTIFKIAPGDSESLLYTFSCGDDGGNPFGPAMDENGNLYGATYTCGASGFGTVFELTPDGNLITLHAFSGGSDGAQPGGAPIRDSHGILFGTTTIGGTGNSGIVYKIGTDGVETVLYTFSGENDGQVPQQNLLLMGHLLYGTTFYGGADGFGTVFNVTMDGRETVLYSFQGGAADGANPDATLVSDSSFLYGTTQTGGTHGLGTVFRVSLVDGTETVLHSFVGGKDGAYPYSGVIEDPSGNLYGTTAYSEEGYQGYGAIFELAGSGKFSTLHQFTNGDDGAYPAASMALDGKNLLGTAQRGGAYGYGVVFQIKK